MLDKLVRSIPWRLIRLKGVSVVVKPEKLSFTRLKQMASYSLTFARTMVSYNVEYS